MGDFQGGDVIEVKTKIEEFAIEKVLGSHKYRAFVADFAIK